MPLAGQSSPSLGDRPKRPFTINKSPSGGAESQWARGARRVSEPEADQEPKANTPNVSARKFSAAPAVGGFIFLRFIGPALLAPGAHGLLDTTQHDGCCRAFILISKVLQNLSNGIEFSKEAFMLKANQFITSNLEKVRGFFEAVASLPATHPHPPTITTVEDVTSHDLRMIHQVLVKNLTRIIKSLAQYKHKDAIPRLWEILTDLGDPNNVYTNPSSSPSTTAHPHPNSNN